MIETVVIPCRRGRNTVCVSSQVGCAMNCQFCYTGRQDFYPTFTFFVFLFKFLIVYDCMQTKAPHVPSMKYELGTEIS